MLQVVLGRLSLGEGLVGKHFYGVYVFMDLSYRLWF